MNERGYESSAVLTIWNCTHQPSWSSSYTCPTVISLSFLLYATLLVGIVCLGWLYRVMIKKPWFALTINAMVCVYLIVYCLYITAFNFFPIWATGQFIGISLFYAMACYFMLSIVSFRIWPEWITERKIIISFIIYYLPFVVIFIVLVYRHSTIHYGCKDIFRYVFLIMMLTVNLIFSVAVCILYFNAQNKVKISKGYLLKHLRPIVIVIIVFTISYSMNFAIYTYYWIVADGMDTSWSCNRVMRTTHGELASHIATFTQIIYLILPCWCIFFYIYTTNRKEERSVHYERKEEAKSYIVGSSEESVNELRESFYESHHMSNHTSHDNHDMRSVAPIISPKYTNYLNFGNNNNNNTTSFPNSDEDK